MGDNGYSQFGIMCTYLMLFHFDKYDWTAQHSTQPTAQARQRAAAKLQQNNLSYSSTSNGSASLLASSSGEVLLPPEVFSLLPRIASHARYRYGDLTNIMKYTEMLNLVLQQGSVSG